MTTPSIDLVPVLAAELGLPAAGVAAVTRLLAEGSTVPFIARYRKEATGDLDEVQIRAIEERGLYLRELEERRSAVLASIDEQGKLTPELRARVLACTTKAALEDLYLPFKPKRRTKATIARERGLEPLSQRILEQPRVGDPRAEAAAYVNLEAGVLDAEAALSGARDIVAEVISEDADVRAFVRETFAKHGVLASEGVPEKTTEPTKFEAYYAHTEPVAQMPSHRFLAIRRGEREGILKVELQVEAERVLPVLEAKMRVDAASPFAGELSRAAADAFKRLLAPTVETDVRVELKQRADLEAVQVFATNLRALLLAAPVGGRAVIGVDPGIRTGCKCAAVDLTGRFLETVTVYPTSQAARAAVEFGAFVAQHKPYAVAVGNGTAGRETEAFVRGVLKDKGLSDVVVVMVNEAGASVYSASDVAREEFPDLDLTIRGAISIARRLQDPLAELVKIDPKAIGVGQYQHDVHQPLLQKKLEEVVESCVNHVGVDLNTASAPLLAQVAGIGPSTAKKIVRHREANGPFASRSALLQVPGLGPKTFEQCAGFLRIRQSAQPLDGSAVHPERYALVERMAIDLGVGLVQLVGNAAQVDRIPLARYVSADVGEPTLRDILAELKKPGRDPRDAFEPPRFREDVHTLEDLKPDMVLEGVVTNVTAFGAFVDIGVHQDGLVHVSQLSDRFVSDPAQVVRAGDKLKVRVLSVDLPRKRISLTARMSETSKSAAAEAGPSARSSSDRGDRGDRRSGGGRPPAPPPKRADEGFKHNPFASLLKGRP